MAGKNRLLVLNFILASFSAICQQLVSGSNSQTCKGNLCVNGISGEDPDCHCCLSCEEIYHRVSANKCPATKNECGQCLEGYESHNPKKTVVCEKIEPTTNSNYNKEEPTSLDSWAGILASSVFFVILLAVGVVWWARKKHLAKLKDSQLDVESQAPLQVPKDLKSSNENLNWKQEKEKAQNGSLRRSPTVPLLSKSENGKLIHEKARKARPSTPDTSNPFNTFIYPSEMQTPGTSDSIPQDSLEFHNGGMLNATAPPLESSVSSDGLNGCYPALDIHNQSDRGIRYSFLDSRRSDDSGCPRNTMSTLNIHRRVSEASAEPINEARPRQDQQEASNQMAFRRSSHSGKNPNPDSVPSKSNTRIHVINEVSLNIKTQNSISVENH